MARIIQGTNNVILNGVRTPDIDADANVATSIGFVDRAIVNEAEARDDAILVETQARTLADSQEVTARDAAILVETMDRTAADESEVMARDAAISVETMNREDADAALQGDINTTNQTVTDNDAIVAFRNLDLLFVSSIAEDQALLDTVRVGDYFTNTSNLDLTVRGTEFLGGESYQRTTSGFVERDILPLTTVVDGDENTVTSDAVFEHVRNTIQTGSDDLIRLDGTQELDTFTNRSTSGADIVLGTVDTRGSGNTEPLHTSFTFEIRGAEPLNAPDVTVIPGLEPLFVVTATQIDPVPALPFVIELLRFSPTAEGFVFHDTDVSPANTMIPEAEYEISYDIHFTQSVFDVLATVVISRDPRVIFNDVLRGSLVTEYDEDVIYNIDDIVYVIGDNGRTTEYRSVQDEHTGNEPVSSTAFWEVSSSSNIPDWDANTTYGPGDCVFAREGTTGVDLTSVGRIWGVPLFSTGFPPSTHPPVTSSPQIGTDWITRSAVPFSGTSITIPSGTVIPGVDTIIGVRGEDGTLSGGIEAVRNSSVENTDTGIVYVYRSLTNTPGEPLLWVADRGATIEDNGGLFLSADRELAVDHRVVLTRWNQFIDYTIGDDVSVGTDSIVTRWESLQISGPATGNITAPPIPNLDSYVALTTYSIGDLVSITSTSVNPTGLRWVYQGDEITSPQTPLVDSDTIDWLRVGTNDTAADIWSQLDSDIVRDDDLIIEQARSFDRLFEITFETSGGNVIVSPGDLDVFADHNTYIVYNNDRRFNEPFRTFPIPSQTDRTDIPSGTLAIVSFSGYEIATDFTVSSPRTININPTNDELIAALSEIIIQGQNSQITSSTDLAAFVTAVPADGQLIHTTEDVSYNDISSPNSIENGLTIALDADRLFSWNAEVREFRQVGIDEDLSGFATTMQLDDQRVLLQEEINAASEGAISDVNITQNFYRGLQVLQGFQSGTEADYRQLQVGDFGATAGIARAILIGQAGVRAANLFHLNSAGVIDPLYSHLLTGTGVGDILAPTEGQSPPPIGSRHGILVLDRTRLENGGPILQPTASKLLNDGTTTLDLRDDEYGVPDLVGANGFSDSGTTEINLEVPLAVDIFHEVFIAFFEDEDVGVGIFPAQQVLDIGDAGTENEASVANSTVGGINLQSLLREAASRGQEVTAEDTMIRVYNGATFTSPIDFSTSYFDANILSISQFGVGYFAITDNQSFSGTTTRRVELFHRNGTNLGLELFVNGLDFGQVDALEFRDDITTTEIRGRIGVVPLPNFIDSISDDTQIPASPEVGDLIFTTSAYVTDRLDLTEPQLTVTASDRLYVFSGDEWRTAGTQHLFLAVTDGTPHIVDGGDTISYQPASGDDLTYLVMAPGMISGFSIGQDLAGGTTQVIGKLVQIAIGSGGVFNIGDDFSPTGAWDFSGSSLVTLPASFELPVGTTIIDNDGAQALVANIDDVTILLDNTIDEQTFVIDNDGFLVANNIRSEALIQDPIANRFELLLGTSSAESNGGPAGDENYTQFVHGIYGTWYLFPARVPGGLFSDNINPDDPNAVTFNLIG